jgi:2,3-bisphosphoglycerate-dependent phosphoglycerate mutase
MMRKISIGIFLCFFLFSGSLFAQKTTIILFRHAEKDTSSKTDKNPALSEAGKQRAENLVKKLEKYRPSEIFSTTYLRTRATVTPLAFNLFQPYRLQLQFYNADEQEKLAEKLLASKTSCIAVVGHSNTIPGLVNLLLKEERFKELADAEYNKIFIVKIRKNKVTAEVIEY